MSITSKVVRVGTYTSIRGNVYRKWEQIELVFNDEVLEVWRWEEDFGDMEGFTMKCHDMELIDDDEWFIPDSSYIVSFKITLDVINDLLKKG